MRDNEYSLGPISCLLLLVLMLFGSYKAHAADSSGHCLAQAAAHYQVNLGILEAIRHVEGGWPGARIRNHNGTHDLGVMQVNSSWLSNPDLKAQGITEQSLANDTCTNYWVATWIYAHALQDTHGDPWSAAGDYHSKTPTLHDAYQRKVERSWLQMGLSDPRQQAMLANVIRAPSRHLVHAHSTIAYVGPTLVIGGRRYQFPGGRVLSRRESEAAARSSRKLDQEASDNWAKFYGGPN